MSQFSKVKKFMTTFGQDVKKKPSQPSVDLATFRLKLILEEALELAEALGVTVSAKNTQIKSCSDLILIKTEEEASLKDVADALADIDYVTLGAAAAFGFNMNKLQKEVHNSNMTKLWTSAETLAAKETEVITDGWTVTEVAALKQDKRFIVKNPFGKVMKSPSYVPADFNKSLPKKLRK